MRRRKTEPLVYIQDGTTCLKRGVWLRKVPPACVSADASGIEITLLSTNDPGPEWFADDGPAVAQLIHDSPAGGQEHVSLADFCSNAKSPVRSGSSGTQTLEA